MEEYANEVFELEEANRQRAFSCRGNVDKEYTKLIKYLEIVRNEDNETRREHYEYLINLIKEMKTKLFQ